MRTPFKVIGNAILIGFCVYLIVKQQTYIGLSVFFSTLVLAYALGCGNAPNDAFSNLRAEVKRTRKHADKLRRNPLEMQLQLNRLGNKIIRARNHEQITELEKNYLMDALNQVLVVPVRFN